MIKGLSRTKLVLVLGISFVLLLFCGLVVGGYIREATRNLEEQKATLETEYERLKKIDDSRSDYESQTARFDEQFAEMTKKYPTMITQNDQILFLRAIEDAFAQQIASASYTTPEAVYQFQYLSPGNEESYQLVRSTIQFPMSLTYEEWKRFIRYIEETDGCDVIESVSADYDEDHSLVNVDVNILQYAVTGADRSKEESVTEVETGTDNIFSSGAVFHKGTAQDMQPTLTVPVYEEPAVTENTEEGESPDGETGEEGDQSGEGTGEEETDTDETDADKEESDGDKRTGEPVKDNESGIRGSIH